MQTVARNRLTFDTIGTQTHLGMVNSDVGDKNELRKVGTKSRGYQLLVMLKSRINAKLLSLS
jgi:hypothetical protein